MYSMITPFLILVYHVLIDLFRMNVELQMLMPSLYIKENFLLSQGIYVGGHVTNSCNVSLTRVPAA